MTKNIKRSCLIIAYIYKITNNINGKIYIGKTEFSVEKRFKEHCQDYKKREFEKRPLYSAMNKYGIDNFTIETIEKTDNPEEREKYWIEYYGSFKTGYNATMGGDGKKYIDYDLVVATYKEIPVVNKVAEKLNISNDSVSRILHLKNVNVLSSTEASKISTGKIVNQYSLTGEYIQSFPSAKAAAESLNKITPISNGASSHITDVCRGKRKTAYGYKWSFSI